MSAIVVQGDAANLHLPDNSVDLVITSPPYFALRSYRDGGSHLVNQIGAEATPAEYISTLLTCTKEWMRVLKPSGSLWVNLGDKYNAYNGGRGDGTIQKNDRAPLVARGNGLDVKNMRTKTLIGLPWRYAIGCIDSLGLILRAEVIWSKPNGLPESVTDRVRRSHETWFHFTMQPRYHSAVDAIREPTNPKVDAHSAKYAGREYGKTNADRGDKGASNFVGNPLGKLPGSVWTIATQPLTVPAELGIDHFAAFPMEFPRRIILGWSPSGICDACGEGRRPTGEARCADDRPGRVQGRDVDALLGGHGADGRAGSRHSRVVTITGETCSCPDTSASTTPAVVLDPLGGTGTVALMADVLGRTGITVDLSYDYCRLAAWRTTDPKQRERAMRPPKAKAS